MDTGLAPVDVAVVSPDPLWAAEAMNAINVRLGDGHVREFMTLLEAMARLTPGYPSVVVCGPVATPDALESFTVVSHQCPQTTFLFAVDDAASDLAAQVLAATTAPALPGDDIAALTIAVSDALDTRRAAAARATGQPAGPTTVETGAGPGERIHIVVVTSAKGGTGSTTVAINIAAAIAQRTDRRVTLVDAHSATGDVALLLGFPPPADHELDDFVVTAETIAHLTRHHERTGIGVVVPPTDRHDLEPLTVRETLEILVALDTLTDLVVVDAPIDLVYDAELATYASSVLLVTTAQVASLKNTLIAADLLTRDDKLGLVVNDLVPDLLEADRSAIEQSLNIAVAAHLPYDEDLVKASTADPVDGIARERSKVAKRLGELADHLLEHRLAVRELEP